MRILITGGAGQLGRALTRALSGFEVNAPGRDELDVTDSNQAHEFVAIGGRKDVVINCAAITDTVRCESDPEAARLVNADGAARIACACSDMNVVEPAVSLFFVSTNEVFNGTKRKPIEEDHVPDPINEYGRSKRDGEAATTSQFEPMHFGHPRIVRTSWLYGDGDTNFVAKVLTAAREGRPLRFVTDEIATPTSADDLAVAIRAMIEAKAPSGIYHLTNEGEASRYEWAREIVRLAGLDESLVEPVTTAELRSTGYDGPRKPAYSVLANTRARALGITMRPWREALAAHFERSRSERDQVAADA